MHSRHYFNSSSHSPEERELQLQISALEPAIGLPLLQQPIQGRYHALCKVSHPLLIILIFLRQNRSKKFIRVRVSGSSDQEALNAENIRMVH